jgi:hypothetical protein
MKTFIRTNIYLSSPQRVALKKISRRRKVSAATVLRELIDKALNLPSSVTEHSHVCGARLGK